MNEQDFLRHVTARKLPNNLGYSASIDGDTEWGSCWGNTEEDAKQAMWLYYTDNRGSLDVLRSRLLWEDIKPKRGR